MKTKKLIAILTIVALMMTLVPMAAFGYDPVLSTVAAYPTTVAANNTATSTVTVTFDTPVTTADSAYIYVWAERNGVITHEDRISDFSVVTGTVSGSAVNDGQGVLAIPLTGADTLTKFTASVKSAFAGKTVVRVGLSNVAPASASTVGDMTNMGQLVMRPEITFAGGSLTAANSTVPGTATYAIGNASTAIDIYVKDSNNYPVAGATVTATSDRIEDTTVISGVTDSTGKATIYFSSTKAGTSNVRVYANGAYLNTCVVTTSGGGVSAVEYYLFGSGKIAKNSTMMVQFKLKDKNGNPATPIFGSTPDTIYYRIDGPAGSPLDLITENTATRSGNVFDGTNVDATYDPVKGVFTVGMGLANTTYTVNGTYKVTVGCVGRDIAATTTFEVVDQGPITGLKLFYWQDKITYGATTEAPVVSLLDKDGVTSNATASNIKYAVNDPRLVTVDNGGVLGIHGRVTALNNSVTGLTGDVVVTATDMVNKVTGSFTIKVAGIPTKIVATSDAATEVGKAAKVSLQMKDFNGNDTSFGDVTTPTMDLIIVSAPQDAKVSYTKGVDFDKALERGGNPYFEVVSDKAGDVVVNIVLGDGANFVSGTATVKFGEPKQVIGAKKVIMFIGTKAYTEDNAAKMTDVAPFIKDDRTFVAVRPVAEAFAAEIGWDEATQTVTLNRADVTVTIVIGSNTINVVRDGVTTTVTADVPAFIVDGRTVLPFRAVGEAFGATVNYDATTQSVSFIQE